PAIVVIVEDCDTGTRGFDNVFFCILAAENVQSGQASLSADVGEVRDGRRQFVILSAYTNRKPKKDSKHGTESLGDFLCSRSAADMCLVQRNQTRECHGTPRLITLAYYGRLPGRSSRVGIGCDKVVFQKKTEVEPPFVGFTVTSIHSI